MSTETLREHLTNALTWQNRLNQAKEVREQGREGRKEALYLRHCVYHEMRGVRKALAELRSEADAEVAALTAQVTMLSEELEIVKKRALADDAARCEVDAKAVAKLLFNFLISFDSGGGGGESVSSQEIEAVSVLMHRLTLKAGA